MTERYEEFLKSDWWKKTRDECLKEYNYRCFCCNSPLDLNVHHLTYEHLGFERPYELVCLCKYCHSWIEDNKYSNNQVLNAKEQMELLEMKKRSMLNPSVKCITASSILNEFYHYCLNNDLSAGGKFDFNNITTIRTQYSIFCVQNGYSEYDPKVSKLQHLISYRRYEVILDYIDHKYPKYITQQRTGFSNAMITKVYNAPEKYRRKIGEYKNAETK